MAVIFVHPSDPTTDFLNGITEYLLKNVHNSLFSLIKIEADDDSHNKCKAIIKSLDKGSTIIFLGHGNYHSLHGAKSDDYQAYNFINASDYNLFSGHKIIFVSCHSKEFINKLDSSSIIASIGFGDIPTEWNEIISARESDCNLYRGLDENIIEQFRSILVNVLKFSFEDAFNENMSFGNLCNLIRLRLNKRISSVILENKSIKSRILSCFLLEIRDEIKPMGNLYCTF